MPCCCRLEYGRLFIFLSLSFMACPHRQSILQQANMHVLLKTKYSSKILKSIRREFLHGQSYEVKSFDSFGVRVKGQSEPRASVLIV